MYGNSNNKQDKLHQKCDKSANLEYSKQKSPKISEICYQKKQFYQSYKVVKTKRIKIKEEKYTK